MRSRLEGVCSQIAISCGSPPFVGDLFSILNCLYIVLCLNLCFHLDVFTIQQKSFASLDTQESKYTWSIYALGRNVSKHKKGTQNMQQQSVRAKRMCHA